MTALLGNRSHKDDFSFEHFANVLIHSEMLSYRQNREFSHESGCSQLNFASAPLIFVKPLSNFRSASSPF